MASGQVIPPGQEDDEEIVVEGSMLSRLEEADRSHQVATAKKFPRSITKFRTLLSEIARTSQPVALEMMYSLPRAGKQLTGPSIRFAEAALTCWGNSRAGVEVVEVNKREGYVVAEGRFYDCESNVGIAIRVRRRNVTTKKDDDSYQVTGVAASSIALRNAILRGVPKALWADIFETAKQTAAGSVQSLDKTRQEMVAIFTAIGVTKERLLKALDVQGSADIGTEEILAMKTWHKQLVSRECTVEDIFGSPEDDEIETLMEELGFNPTMKRQARTSYSGNRKGLLDYLRGESAKAAQAMGQKPQEPAQAPTGPQAAPTPPPAAAAAREPGDDVEEPFEFKYQAEPKDAKRK